MTAAQPYPGLRPFEADEVDVFFGREQQIDQLLDRLDRSRLLAVVGSSGCGKSSLVRAGLIPALETGFLASAGARWRVAEMRPGNEPLRRLAGALLADSALGPERGGVPGAVGFLLAALRRGPLGLAEVLTDTPPPEGTRLLLLVDQFEEIFRYFEHGDSDEADAFVALLLAAVARPDVPLYVVLTMRSDYLGDCALFEGLPEALNESQFLTPRMRREQRREAIVGPAGVFGAQVEPALVNRLLNDMGADPDQLPLMQHVLMRLWHRAGHSAGDGGAGAGTLLTVADYEAVGGFADALSRHADEAYEELDDEGRRIAMRLFRALCERGEEGRDVRRPARLREVAEVADVTPQRVAEVVEVFRRPERSFLTPPAGVELEPESVLDISHESLIRQWRRLREWVERETLSATVYRRLAQTARLWKEDKAGLWGAPDLDVALGWQERQSPTATWARRYGGGFEAAMEFLDASRDKRRQDEEAERRSLAVAEQQKRVRQRNRLLTVGLLVAAALLLLAFWQWRRADHQRDVARRQTLVAEAGELIANAREMIEDRPQRGLLLSVEALRLDQEAGAKNPSGVQAVQRGLSASGGDALTGHTGDVVALTVTPDGRRLITGSVDGTARVWDLTADDPGAEPRVLAGHEGALTSLALDSTGRRLATGGADGSIALWQLDPGADAEAAAAQTLTSGKDPVTALAFDRRGRWLFSGTEGGAVQRWDLGAGGGTAPRSLTRHSDTVTVLATSPDGRWLASGSEDNTVALLDLTAADPTAGSIVLEGHRGPVNDAVFTADSRWLATAGSDNTARLWRLDDPLDSPLVLCGHYGTVSTLAVTPDGRFLITGSSDSTARVWRLPAIVAGAAALRRRDERPLVAAAIEPAACRHLLVGDAVASGAAASDTLADDAIWDLRGLDPAVTALLSGHDDAITALAVSPAPPGKQDRYVATASLDHTVRVWSLTAEHAGLTSLLLRGHDGAVETLAFNPRGPWLYSGSTDSTARRWNLDFTDKTLLTLVLSGPRDAVRTIDLSSDGRRLVAGSDDNNAYLWDFNHVRPPSVLNGHESSISAVGMSPDDRWLATASEDNTIRLWDLSATAEAPASRVLGGNASSVTSLAFTPDSRYLATAGRDGTARIWSLEADDPATAPTVLCGHRKAVIQLRVSADGRWMATVDRTGAARLWDLAALAPLLPSARRPTPLLAAALDEATCRRLTADGADLDLQTLDAASAPALPAYREAFTAVTFVSASDKAGWLATGSADGALDLWDLDDPAAGSDAWVPLELHGYDEAVNRLAASADGRWLASAGNDQTAALIDLAADGGPRVWTLRDHRAPVIALAFSPDGHWLATGSADGEARLWDLTSDDPAAAPGVLYGHRGAVTSVIFAPDSTWLATGSRDHTVRVWATYLWSLDAASLTDLACRVAGRSLTRAEWDEYLPRQPYQPTCKGRPAVEAPAD